MNVTREKVAIEFLKSKLIGSEFENRVFLAGGAVRDMVMNQDPKDLDVVVTGGLNSGIEFATWISQESNCFSEGSNPVIFLTYGTAKVTLRRVNFNGVNLDGVDVEAVATRTEKYEHGSRKPIVAEGSLRDDVFRRDCNANSLLMNISTGEIIDMTGNGISDIKNGIVRTPLDPDITFADDPLRMLRAIRFAVKYNWKLPLFMIRALKRNAEQLRNISNERINDELCKILVSNSPVTGIRLLLITGLLEHICPELVHAHGMTQNVHHSRDVFGHTMDVLSNTEPVLLQRLIALFHDIGKVETRTESETGVHFYAHEVVGSSMVKRILSRLKFPNEVIDKVSLGVHSHMRLKHGGHDGSGLSDKSLRKFKIAANDILNDLLVVIHSDNIAHSPSSSMPDQIPNLRQRIENLDIRDIKKPALPINGNDLLDLGLERGPIFGEILNEVTEAWFENPNISREEALEIVKRRL